MQSGAWFPKPEVAGSSPAGDANSNYGNGMKSVAVQCNPYAVQRLIVDFHSTSPAAPLPPDSSSMQSNELKGNPLVSYWCSVWCFWVRRSGVGIRIYETEGWERGAGGEAVPPPTPTTARTAWSPTSSTSTTGWTSSQSTSRTL